MEAFGFITFCLVIYIISAMPTKNELRKLLTVRDTRASALRSLLAEHVGTACTLLLADATATAPGTSVSGVLQDVDDEWLLIECPVGKGATQLKALRLEYVSGIEEQGEERGSK